MTQLLLGKTYNLLYFNILPEDPDPGSGSDCLSADRFTMTGTKIVLHGMISD